MSTRIQIIDANKDHLQTLSSALLMHGNLVACYDNAEEGYEDFYKYRPHLLIVEPTLEGSEMKGWELAYNILRDYPHPRPYMIALCDKLCCHQRICFCSPPPRRRTIKALCEETGFDEFHVKAIDLDVLLDWVSKAKEKAISAA